ncbi:MAG: OmpA family protein [Nitrospirales bacterium]
MCKLFRAISLLSAFGLTLISFAGCGEKRVHVSTLSGAPGDELALEPIDESVQAPTAGLANSLVDESNLLSKIPDGEATSGEQPVSVMNNEPIHFAHEPSTSGSTQEATPSDATFPSLESELADNASPFASLADGQDFAAQSDSSSGDHSPSGDQLSHDSSPSQPNTAQDLGAGMEETLSGSGLEPIPDTFQIAKVVPGGSSEDQMNRIKTEELAAAAAGLEDVFFQFDSWTLTQEGKQTLERTAGWFSQEPSSKLIIEGHTDQRGTQAYNMVLAKKRAVAVQEYLSQLGVENSRLAIISYGKDKPFCQEATEVCHQLNRRGHLLVQNP